MCILGALGDLGPIGHYLEVPDSWQPQLRGRRDDIEALIALLRSTPGELLADVSGSF